MSELRFEVKRFRGEGPTTRLRPVVCLARDRWDDFSFKTQFYGTIYVDTHRGRPLGDVKILKRRATETADAMPAKFEELDSTYVSLWQAPESYERIKRLGAYARPLLDALRDAAVDPVHARSFEDDPGWKALTRFPEAEAALERGRELFGAASPTGRLRFEYRLSPKAFGLAHRVDFDFDREHPWGRLFVLAGENGTGKTGLISHLARTLSGMILPKDDPGRCVPDRLPLRVVAVSYSPFDRFRRPHRRSKSYKYCGLRDESQKDLSHRINVDGRLEDVGYMLDALSDERLAQIRSILKTLDILPRNDPDGFFQARDFDRFVASMRVWSAGHQIVSIVVVHLVTWIQRNTLVLFDEPELHLHPTLLSTLLRCIHALLVERDAFCVVATHSPVPVQEVPKRFVRVLERNDTTVTATIPADETFGADLGRIVASVFRLGPEDQNYLTTLLEAIEPQGGVQRVRRAFGDAPSLSVRVALDAREKSSRKRSR